MFHILRDIFGKENLKDGIWITINVIGFKILEKVLNVSK
jgi:hypothetical protein